MRSVDVVGSVDSNKVSSWSDHWLDIELVIVWPNAIYISTPAVAADTAPDGSPQCAGCATLRMVWSASCQHVIFSHLDIRRGSGSMLMSAAPPPQGAECQLMWTFVKNLIKTLGQHNIATLSLFNSTHCTDYTRVPRMISPCVGLSSLLVVAWSSLLRLASVSRCQELHFPKSHKLGV